MQIILSDYNQTIQNIAKDIAKNEKIPISKIKTVKIRNMELGISISLYDENDKFLTNGAY